MASDLPEFNFGSASHLHSFHLFPNSSNGLNNTFVMRMKNISKHAGRVYVLNT